MLWLAGLGGRVQAAAAFGFAVLAAMAGIYLAGGRAARRKAQMRDMKEALDAHERISDWERAAGDDAGSAREWLRDRGG